jgi:Tfp pilus assembly protein PilZ
MHLQTGTQTSKRADPRFALEIDAALRSGDQMIPARTRNVSRGGLAITAPRALPVGADVTVSLSLVFLLDEAPVEVEAEARGTRTAMSEPLPLQGRVVWCSPVATEKGAAFQLGVMFVGMRQEERSYVDMFLRYLKE